MKTHADRILEKLSAERLEEVFEKHFFGGDEMPDGKIVFPSTSVSKKFGSLWGFGSHTSIEEATMAATEAKIMVGALQRIAIAVEMMQADINYLAGVIREAEKKSKRSRRGNRVP